MESRGRWPFAPGFGDDVSPQQSNGCAADDHQRASAAKMFWAAVGVNGGVMASRVLGCLADGAEWRGDFLKPRVELDCLGQFFDAEINGAAANLVAVGVGMNPV